MSKRQTSYVKTAEFRAAAVAHINTLTEPTSGSQILYNMREKIEELGLTDKQALIQLRQLGDVGLIQKEKKGKDYYYYSGKSTDPKVAGQAGPQWKGRLKTAQPPIPSKSNEKVDLPGLISKLAEIKQKVTLSEDSIKTSAEILKEIKIDVIEDTNRIRITYCDLQIDIGSVKK